MPERIYMNHRPGERRIHIELSENDVADILDDFDEPPADAFEATKQLHRLLVAAQERFATSRQRDAAEAEASRT